MVVDALYHLLVNLAASLLARNHLGASALPLIMTGSHRAIFASTAQVNMDNTALNAEVERSCTTIHAVQIVEVNLKIMA